jgi:DNA-binding MarR family transcriptional regulator
LPKSGPALENESAVQLRAVIGRLSRRLRPTTAAIEAGLTPTRVSVLLHVVRAGPVRLAELGAAEGINPTMLSRVIAHLVEAGLIERTSDEGDRRSAWATATDAGARLARAISRERTDALNVALEGLSEVDRRRIGQAVPALEALAEHLAEVRR